MEALGFLFGWYAEPWAFLVPSLLFTTMHVLLAEPWLGDGAPFWKYHGRLFGHDLSSWIGIPLFVAFWGVLCSLSIYGYGFGSMLFLGALYGAKSSDSLLSHIYLKWRFPDEPNPGYATSYLNLIEVVLGLLNFAVTFFGFVIGFGVFAAFWALSFAFGRLPVPVQQKMNWND